MVHYELDGGFIRSRNFTDGKELNFEPMSAVMGENEDYDDCFNTLHVMSHALSEQYLQIVWMDTVCGNVDRHTENYGFLRDVKTGNIISMAPNYDNNIALISRGYPASSSRKGDGLIRFFSEFMAKNRTARETLKNMSIPEITESDIRACLDEIPIEVDEKFGRDYILNGQKMVNAVILDERLSVEPETCYNIKL